MAELKVKHKCDYCGQPVKQQPVIKVMLKQKHIFCTEVCWALYRYSIPKKTVYVNWS